MRYKRLTDKDWHKEKFYGHSDCERTILKRLWDLENKIEQGMLIELPCKVGDTVYEIIQGLPIQEWNIHAIFWGKTYGNNYVMDAERQSDLAHWKFWKEDFGKTIFLTREEAEKRLKELQNG